MLPPVADGISSTSALRPNYPNPFHGRTTLSFLIGATANRARTWRELAIDNLDGQQVRSLVSGWQIPGSHSVTWDGADDRGGPQAAGLYLIRLRTRSSTHVGKMMLIK